MCGEKAGWDVDGFYGMERKVRNCLSFVLTPSDQLEKENQVEAELFHGAKWGGYSYSSGSISDATCGSVAKPLAV